MAETPEETPETEETPTETPEATVLRFMSKHDASGFDLQSRFCP